MAIHYGIPSVPTMFLVGRDGKVLSLRARGQALDRLLQEQIGAPYQPRGKLVCLDFRAKANRKRAEMYTGFPDNNLGGLPAGEQVLGGVRFKIGEAVIQLAGQKLTDAPAKVEGIAVGSNVARLYLLHAAQFAGAQFGVSPGMTIGAYEVRYEDSSTASIPIVVGQDVRDWWNEDAGGSTSRGTVVWTGTSRDSKAANVDLRLYLSAWDNPEPGKRVARIDFVSASTPAAPFCVAVTVENPTSAE
jgi:hypothetical protein